MRGFTLIEILVTFALLTVIGSATVWWSSSIMPVRELDEETESLARTLMRAREYALTRGASYTVCLGDGEYRLFRTGESGEYESFAYAESIVITDLPECDEGIVFAALSANVTPATIVLKEGERSRAIEVNAAGRIAW